jgi:hypothetical protein
LGLFFTEMNMTKLATTNNGHPIQGAFHIGTSQDVAVGIASASSAAVAFSTKAVRLFSTTDCRIAIGSGVTATATSTFLPAGKPEVFLVTSGDVVAVIQASAAGTLNITELA